VAVHALGAVGRLDVIRVRRNSDVLNDAQRERVVREIAAIRAQPLPVKSNSDDFEILS
jgi:hypothetical protein